METLDSTSTGGLPITYTIGWGAYNQTSAQEPRGKLCLLVRSTAFFKAALIYHNTKRF